MTNLISRKPGIMYPQEEEEPFFCGEKRVKIDMITYDNWKIEL